MLKKRNMERMKPQDLEGELVYGGVHKLRWQDFAHNWPPTHHVFTFYCNKGNLYTIDISITPYLSRPINVVCEYPLCTSVVAVISKPQTCNFVGHFVPLA